MNKTINTTIIFLMFGFYAVEVLYELGHHNYDDIKGYHGILLYGSKLLFDVGKNIKWDTFVYEVKSTLRSFWEASIDVGSGFIVALLAQLKIIPFLFDIEFTQTQNVGIVLTFTCISIIRSTIWRKYFKNKYKRKTIEQLNATGYCRVCKRGE